MGRESGETKEKSFVIELKLDRIWGNMVEYTKSTADQDSSWRGLVFSGEYELRQNPMKDVSKGT